MKLRLHVIVLSGILGLIFSSCKKEYVDKYNIIPGDTINIAGYTNITSFQVSEFSKDTVLKASIKGDTIIVYWPTYKPIPATIKPSITLPDSAAISPASGVEVPFKTGTVYTVTSGAGTSHNYILKVDLQQPQPYFYSALKYILFENGSYQTLGSGDYFIPDTAMTKVYLVSASDATAYQAEIFSTTTVGPTFFVPMNVPEGLYDVKVVNGIHTVYNSVTESRNAVKVSYPTYPQVFGVNIPDILHRNDTFVVRGCLLASTTSAVLYDLDLNKSELEIVSKAVDRVVLRVPADYPLNNYLALQLLLPDEQEATGNVNITIQQ